MAQGETLEEAVAGAQTLGIAEADPSNDLEGWDASVKATVLANVLMDADLRPADVRREGLGAEAMRRGAGGAAAGRRRSSRWSRHARRWTRSPRASTSGRAAAEDDILAPSPAWRRRYNCVPTRWAS